jgi:uncharacterized repeat protein (TIGR03803 family)
MKHSLFPSLLVLLAAPVTLLLGSLSASAGTEKILHQFDQTSHGDFTNGVVADAQGNLYGTTVYGGTFNHGTVFKMSPKSSGGWTETVLYSFTGASDGDGPEANVTLDTAGNIYGTTLIGGASNNGTVFELSPNGKGGWNQTVLHNFAGGDDGDGPNFSSLAVDTAGNVYGTTDYGGAFNYGIAFQLTLSGGNWTENILHTFTGGSDGGDPGGLVLDKYGNLYGYASIGGSGDALNGLVFELTPSAGGNWTENILYNFAGGTDGSLPNGGPLFDSAGNLFGTTATGGTGGSCYFPNAGCGIVFELSPQSGGSWTKSTLYNFTNSQEAGIAIGATVSAFDKAGNLYGASSEGGMGNCDNGCGTLFELSPGQEGQWTFRTLHSFTAGNDGYYPVGGVVLGSLGQLYGSTSVGGATGLNGTVFALKPIGTGQWKLATLYDFPFTDGSSPYTSLLPGGSGNFYGTTSYGGSLDEGTIFQLTLTDKGTWKETILYNFPPGRLTGVNGVSPSSLISDAEGNLYGTATYSGPTESGSVFELSPATGGGWTETDLFFFSGFSYPMGGVVSDKAGNLYGTTNQGGSNGKGVVFELSPSSGGNWTEQAIYAFAGYPSDGANPAAALTIDDAGNLYGTTQNGGSSTNCLGGAGKPIGCGTVFNLSRNSSEWTESVLYSFAGSSNDGANPMASLIFDGSGNLYGTTAHGGIKADCYVNYNQPTCGTVFELSPAGTGWTEKVLYKFANSGGDGGSPIASLLFDSIGNLYGTTSLGGAFSQNSCRGSCGTVFKLTPVSGGWTETVLYSFGNGFDGQYPAAGLVFDSAGNLYGTTAAGGNAGVGIVFEITP